MLLIKTTFEERDYGMQLIFAKRKKILIPANILQLLQRQLSHNFATSEA